MGVLDNLRSPFLQCQSEDWRPQHSQGSMHAMFPKVTSKEQNEFNQRTDFYLQLSSANH